MSNDCDKCGRDSDELFFHKVKDEWWCEHCWTLTGEKLFCYSCSEGDENE